MPRTPNRMPNRMPNWDKAIQSYEKLYRQKAKQCKDIRRYNKLWDACTWAPNNETSRWQLNLKSLAPQGFLLFLQLQNRMPYTNMYANLQAKTHGKIIKNKPMQTTSVWVIFLCANCKKQKIQAWSKFKLNLGLYIKVL